MRDILFRGKRTGNGAWACGYLFCFWERACLCWGMRNNVPVMEEVIPETVGQYTGLKDKNGKKIFEGDICEVTVFTCEGEDKHFLCEVCFEYHSFIFRNLKRSNFDIPFSDIYDFSTDVEIIGNIYDNPELLKGGEEE